MAYEMKALEKNGTQMFALGKQLDSCKWVCKNKHKEDGTIERYKLHSC